MLQKIKNIIVPIIGAFILSGSCSKQNEANLKDDALELMNTYSIQVSEPSGLAINSEGTNLYTVSDNTNKIYKLSSTGTILKTYNYEGNDLEGVTTFSNNKLLVVEERTKEVVEYDMGSGSYIKHKIDYENTDSNSGLEGITYNFNDNTIKSTHQKYQNLFYDERLISGVIRSSEQTLKTYYTPVNHTIFAQNVVNESKTGKLPKTAQLFIGSLGTASNNGQISPAQLAKLFRTSQGLIEVPIHLILYIGGLYDFYYYGTPDKDIDLSVINGLTNKEGVDILSDKLLLNKKPLE